MLHAPPQLVCLGRVEYYDYDDRPAGVCNFAASSASPDVSRTVSAVLLCHGLLSACFVAGIVCVLAQVRSHVGSRT